MFFADRRPSQIGVKNRSGSVYHLAHIWRVKGLHSPGHIIFKSIDLTECLSLVCACPDKGAQTVCLGTHCLHDCITAVIFNQSLYLLICKQHIHFGYAAV